MLIFAFMHHPHLVCIPFGMPSLHLFTFLFSCYFTSGWVGTCFIHEGNRELSVLKAAVKPSQLISQQPASQSFSCCEKEGWSARYTCMYT